MTSLAKQLQKLAIPGQPSLRQIVSRKRPSLLFDAKEAADIDIETIYALGTNGLEELINIDQSFADFETNLFQESCKEFERTVQTKEVLEDWTVTSVSSSGSFLPTSAQTSPEVHGMANQNVSDQLLQCGCSDGVHFTIP